LGPHGAPGTDIEDRHPQGESSRFEGDLIDGIEST